MFVISIYALSESSIGTKEKDSCEELATLVHGSKGSDIVELAGDFTTRAAKQRIRSLLTWNLFLTHSAYR